MTTAELNQLGDGELVRLFQKESNLEAMGILFKRYRHLVFGACLKILDDKHASKDMTMEIFEYLMEVLPEQKVFTFKAWLYKLTQNKCLNYLREKYQEKREIQAFEKKMKKSWEIFMENDPFSTLIGRDPEVNLKTEIDEAICTLKPEQQICLRLFYWDKLPYKNISAETGFDDNLVKSYIQNGKRKIGIYLTKKREGG